MLQQILQDMWVDPEILAGLDEEQKQTLFCKMREEQVRKWKMWDQQVQNDPFDLDDVKHKKTVKKCVSFLKGSDGEPWVWVMGEHKNDRSIDDILKEEAIDKARKLAEKETEELRKQVEAELSEYIDLTPKIEIEISSPKLKIEDDVDIYCSVDELREKMTKPVRNNNFTFNYYNNKLGMFDTRDVLQEISLNTQKVAQRVALWEKRLTEERTCEIFQRMQRKRMESAKEAEEAEKKQEQLWQEQERKAKEAEQQIREIARKAREQHRLNSESVLDNTYSEVSGVPPGKQAVLEWYRKSELPKKAGMDPLGNLQPWFHGLITRLEAESLLSDQADGTFLVRLSERIWGYALSYRAPDKCKHYLVNAGKHYNFFGKNHVEHKSLGDLILYHRQFPLSGGEKLKQACPRNGSASLIELFGESS